jgi:hypothetical protein
LKRILAFMLCAVMCACFYPAARAADARDLSFEASLASQLGQLGLFKGVSEQAGGTADFELSRGMNRAEALVMLVRALGKGAEAEACPKTHPFADVPVWADGYVSYAYGHGLTKGESGTRFGAGDAATAEEYLTFLLRALGYSEGAYGDFTWDAPQALAAWCGILPDRVDQTDFLRADAVDVTCAALYATVKGTDLPLHESLASQGVFTGEQFDAAFPADPFADDRLLDSRVSEAIAARVKLGTVENNVYAAACHVITDISEADGVLTVSALVCYQEQHLPKDNVIPYWARNGTVAPWLIELDAETLQPLGCRLAYEIRQEGFALTEFFSEKTLTALSNLRMAMRSVCLMEVQSLIDSGVLAYRQPTYEEALAKAKAALTEGLQTLGPEPCTVLLGRYDYPSGGVTYYEAWLVYRPGSAVGEGETARFRGSAEGKLWLSEDGLTLYYSYHYDNSAIYGDSPPTGPHSIPVRGTHTYTIDLSTGNYTEYYQADDTSETT